jgi:hypothetical protein
MPRRIASECRETRDKAAASDIRGIGCGLELIEFSFPDGGSYVCSNEKASAEAILRKNKKLWPAVVIFPSGLTPELLYAQCTFKYAPHHHYNYKEASGINNFLRKGNLVEFMREYEVKSLIVGPAPLAAAFSRIGELRVDRSLFVIGPDARAIPYHTNAPDENSVRSSQKPTATGSRQPDAGRGRTLESPTTPSKLRSLLGRLFR